MKQTKTVTGKITSKAPPFQEIERGSKDRKSLGPYVHLTLEMDYEKLEARIAKYFNMDA